MNIPDEASASGNWLLVHHFGNYYLVRGTETVRVAGKPLIHNGGKP